MATRKEVIARIEDLGLVAVIRLHDESRMDEVVEALGSADAKIIEITMTVPGAIELISRYTKEFRRDYLFGCGTVTDEATASNAIEAGAAFVVSPVLDQDVVEATISSGVAMIPAAMTPSEAWRAYKLGADAIKLFPARVLGPRYVSDVMGPLPELKIIPSGGIGLDNAASFIEAGALAVFSGSSLVNDTLVGKGGFEEISRIAREMIINISRAKGGNQ